MVSIIADVYCETVTKLKRATQIRRRAKLSSVTILLHDNARLHTAALTLEKNQNFRWKLCNLIKKMTIN